MSLRRAAFVGLFVLLHAWAAVNAVRLSRDLLTGDGSAETLAPHPRWGFMRVPDAPGTRRYRAEHRLAADFAQVYFPARDAARLADAYTPQTTDPWQRPSRYPPFVHALCAATLCRLSYGPASVAHLAVQVLLFYASYVYAFRALGVGPHLPAGLLLASVALFLTPTGLAWYERGQFSLYVALGYLWLVLGLLRRRAVALVLAAVFTTVKLTTAPFAAVALGLWVLGAADRTDLRARLRLALVFASVALLLLLGHWPAGVAYLAGLVDQEARYLPFGVSLTRLLPKALVKLMPLGLLAVGLVHRRRVGPDYGALVPCLTGAAILLVTYPTWAFDYGVSSVLAFVPLLRHWARRPEVAPHAIGRLLVALLPAFILVASFALSVTARLHWPETVQVYGYVLAAAAFLAVPLGLPRSAASPSVTVSA